MDGQMELHKQKKKKAEGPANRRRGLLYKSERY